MNKKEVKSYVHLITFVLIFFLAYESKASEKCVDLFNTERIVEINADVRSLAMPLGEVKTHLQKSISKQCLGTCYFEGAVNTLESMIHVKLNEVLKETSNEAARNSTHEIKSTVGTLKSNVFDFLQSLKIKKGLDSSMKPLQTDPLVQISRLHLLGQVILNQLQYLGSSVSGKENLLIIPSLIDQSQIVDVISSGNINRMENIFSRNPIYLVKAKNNFEMAYEDVLLKELTHYIGKRIFEIVATDGGLQRLENIEKLKRDYQISPQEQTKSELLNLEKEFNLFRMKKINSSLKELQAQIESFIQKESKLKILKKIWMINQYYPLNLDFKKSQNHKTQEQQEYRFNAIVEDKIKFHLKNQEELMLTYFHYNPYLQTTFRGRKGLVDIRDVDSELKIKDQVISNAHSRGGHHLVAVVDYLLDAEGRISHLVIRNSWGMQSTNTDQGYNYISVDYLKVYGVFLGFHFVKLEKLTD